MGEASAERAMTAGADSIDQFRDLIGGGLPWRSAESSTGPAADQTNRQPAQRGSVSSDEAPGITVPPVRV